MRRAASTLALIGATIALPTGAPADHPTRGPACTAPMQTALPAAEGENIVEHCIQVEPDVYLYVLERFTDAALARTPPRAILLMPATLVTHAHWASDVIGTDSYNGLYRASRSGFRAYAFDYFGYGRSTRPANGLDANKTRLLNHTGALVEWIRARSGAATVDLAGISLGSLLASAVGGVNSPIDPAHVGKLVLTAVVYKDVSPVLGLTLLSPAGCDVQRNSPDGYIDTPAAAYALLIATSDVPPQLWCYLHCPGRYAAGPTLTGCDLPVFPAGDGRAPALVFWGDRDLVSPRNDVEAFVADYGGPATFRVMEGGSHTLHWESIRDRFWSETFAFLDP